MRIYDRTRYITLFGSEKYEAIYNRIRYLISRKSCITYILTLHDVTINIKSALNKDENSHYYYEKLLEKRSYYLAKK